MKIIDLEQHTGLDRATIRYYEKQGFITPVRLENGYREYSPEDESQLLKIKLLRQLGLSLDRIRNLQQGSEDFSAALQDQIRTLESNAQSINRAKDICQELQRSGVSYDTLDASTYLQKLSEPAQSSAVKVSKSFHEPGLMRECHPVRRFVARYIDYSLLYCLIRFLLIVVFRIRPFTDTLSNLITYGTPFLAVPLFALLMHWFGTTPGKWVMGIRIDCCNGGNLCYARAVQREWDVLRYGLGFGIPLWRLWRLYKSYVQHVNSFDMDWDNDTEYTFLNWNVKKKAVFAGITAVIIALMSIIAVDVMKPKYRGDELTISQFAENYNYYLYVITNSTDGYAKLQSDGTKYPVPENTVYIDISATPRNENVNFEYEMEGEYIRRISYQNSWTEINLLRPISNTLQLAAITTVMSQDGVSYSELEEFIEILEEKTNETDCSIRCRNVEIHWNIVSEGCRLMSDYYTTADSSKESSLSLEFEIIIHQE